MNEALDKAENFYVYDARAGAEPLIEIYAKTILAAPPNKQHYGQWVKMPECAELFMPVWELDELQLCREQCYPGIEADSVAYMYSLVGGGGPCRVRED